MNNQMNYQRNYQKNNYQRDNYQDSQQKKASQKFADEKFFERVENDFAQVAESVVLKLEKDKNGNIALNTNQIRNILDLINGVSEKVTLHNGEDISCFKNEILYIRVKLAYIYGKSKQSDGVKDFIDKSELIELLLCVGTSKQKYQIFAKYVEALVAFHKYYGGKDD